jgi:hypothetical protein
MTDDKAEHLILIADSLLLPFVEGLFKIHDGPAWLDTPITVIAAEHPPRLLCRERFPLDGPPDLGAKRSTTGFALGPALDLLFTAAGPDFNRRRGVHLCVVAAASNNVDDRLMDQLSRLRDQKRLYRLAIDLGGYLERSLGKPWQEVVDFLVTHPSNQIRAADLQSLMAWFPSCHEGFKMYDFEGHHPGEPTWLRHPPPPFVGLDCIAARMRSLFGK